MGLICLGEKVLEVGDMSRQKPSEPATLHPITLFPPNWRRCSFPIFRPLYFHQLTDQSRQLVQNQHGGQLKIDPHCFNLCQFHKSCQCFLFHISQSNPRVSAIESYQLVIFNHLGELCQNPSLSYLDVFAAACEGMSAQ